MSTATRCRDCGTYTCTCPWSCWTCQAKVCTCEAEGRVPHPVELQPCPLVDGQALVGVDLDDVLGPPCPGCAYRVGHHPTCLEAR